MNEEQYKESLILREIVYNKIAKDEPADVLNSWVSPCETFRCVAGDYVVAILGDGYELDCYAFKLNSKHGELLERVIHDFKGVFGFRPGFLLMGEDCSVIGGSRLGSLQRRLTYIERMIEKNGYTLPNL